MNLPLSIEQLKQLRSIMQTMLVEANNANWQELSRLDSERRVLIGYKERPGISNQKHGEKASEFAQLRPASNKVSCSPTRSEARSVSSSEAAVSTTVNSTGNAPDEEYVALSKELTALDKEITKTVLDARHALLEQTRVLRAQVSAKKGYEQANTMKISSYS